MSAGVDSGEVVEEVLVVVVMVMDILADRHHRTAVRIAILSHPEGLREVGDQDFGQGRWAAPRWDTGWGGEAINHRLRPDELRRRFHCMLIIMAMTLSEAAHDLILPLDSRLLLRVPGLDQQEGDDDGIQKQCSLRCICIPTHLLS